MASDQTTDHLIDLLYGELTQEEDSSLRENVAQSTEMQAELAELELLFQQVGDAVEIHDVPTSLHDSIMDAARDAAAKSVEHEARAIRMPNVGPNAPTHGIWGRLRSSQFSQIAMVATVLFAGAFVFRFVSMSDSTAPGMVHMEKRPAMMEAAAPSAPETEVNNAPPKEIQHPAEKSVGKATGAAADESWGPAKKKVARKDVANAPSSAQPRPQVVAKSKTGKKQLKAKKSRPPKKTRAKRQSAKSMFDAPMKNAPTKTLSKPEPAPEPVAAAEAEPKQDKREFKPAEGTLDAAQESFNRRDFRETIKQADSVLAGSARLSDKARALELKAQAYNRMGMVSQADATYRNLQNNYPNYNTTSVRAARDEISRRLNQKREQKKRSVQPKNSYDFEADTVPASQD